MRSAGESNADGGRVEMAAQRPYSGLVDRGEVRVYLGVAPGAGATCAMLAEGHRLAQQGRDVVVGFVDTRGRAGTTAAVAGLEVIRPVHVGGEALMDVAAVLARRPEVVLVDDLARSAEGEGRTLRHRDLAALVERGIDVVTTVEVRALASVSDLSQVIAGVRPGHTVPDHVVRAADQVQLVDLPPQQLRTRLADGHLFPAEEVDATTATLFRLDNLAALREVALRWLADRIDDDLVADGVPVEAVEGFDVRERVVVAVTGRPGGDRVVRRAARLAGRGSAELLGVHVQVTRDRDAETPLLESQRTVLESLGGTLRAAVADSQAEGVLTVARAERATQVVVGVGGRRGWGPGSDRSLLRALLEGSGPHLDVHVISTADQARTTTLPRSPRLGVLGLRRRIAGFVLALVGLMSITAVLAPEAGLLGLGVSGAPQVAPEALTTPLLLYLALTAAVAAVGGLWPGITCAVAGVLLGNAVFTKPRGSFVVHAPGDIVALLVFLLISVLVSTLTDLVARRAAQTARARAEVRVLTRLAATIPAVDDPLARLTEDIRDLFDLDGVALVRQVGPAEWAVECATGDAPARPAEADDELRVDAERLLLLRGPRAPAEDRRLLAAVVTQLAVAATRRSLDEATTALREANAAGDLRTALLSAVSHDLRTPLASIKAGASSMLATDVELTPELVSEFATAIVADSDRLNRLVTNLLDMSRLHAGATAPLLEPVGIDEVVALALDRTPAEVVDVRMPAELPDVWADAALLERVLANLIDNAVTARDGRPVLVWAGEVPDGVLIRVIDHGRGIPAEDIEVVFQPFQRLGDAPRGRGVGLGLAIAKGFTDAMGGQLRVEPTPGGGTTMALTLPLAAARAAAPPPTAGSVRG